MAKIDFMANVGQTAEENSRRSDAVKAGNTMEKSKSV